MFEEELLIPEQRVGFLIGKEGKSKKKLEKELKVKIKVSRNGRVEIRSDDSLTLFIAKLVIKAIGRGFSVKNALMLKNENYSFELIELRDYGRNKEDIKRIKSRIIGREGLSKKKIEETTESMVIIYGDTVGIIGEIEDVMLAKTAVEMLINGAKHSNVFTFLEKKRKENKMRRMLETHKH